VLKVRAGATAASLKEAYRVAAVASHPDRHPPERKVQATREFQRCSEAFAILNDRCLCEPADSGEAKAGKAGDDRRSTGFRRSSGGDDAGGDRRYADGHGIDAGRLFRETFGSLSDPEVLQAILNHRVGETTGMAMLSLRRITGQISGGSAAAGAAATGQRAGNPGGHFCEDGKRTPEPFYGGNPARGSFYGRFSWRPL
jgi:DnaJ-class molecular chaperone